MSWLENFLMKPLFMERAWSLTPLCQAKDFLFTMESPFAKLVEN